ncbi:MAG: spore germination protein [Lachnospiraceae bacterium]|nr:spore germination protein [Lachnospiraceae bacterium]
MNQTLSTDLTENIRTLHSLLPIDKSFDLVTRDLYLGETRAYWIGVNGFCKTELLQRIFSDLQSPGYTRDAHIDDLIHYMNAKIGFAQVEADGNWHRLLQNLLSGPSLLFVEGFDQALILDARTYPSRSISEPDAERVTLGARDGFVETMLFNANLIRRRVRANDLVFAIHTVGSASRTDVAIAYLENNVNRELLQALTEKLEQLNSAANVTSLTMGAKSLSELLVPHKWWNPLPSVQYTERPDVACSYLMEGHILILVDNSPQVLLLPGTIFQFTQSPEDYYKSPLVGSYFRLVRLLCIPTALLLLPVFLLITVYFPQLSEKMHLLSTVHPEPWRLILYVFVVEFVLDLFKYSAAQSSGHFSAPLSIVGGLLIGDAAVTLNWASTEVLFYGAVSLLATLSISSLELADALRVYRIFLLITTAAYGLVGFLIGLGLVGLSCLLTPTFGGMSYFWPLFPWNKKALATLLFRYPTVKAQPSRTWNRGPVRQENKKD